MKYKIGDRVEFVEDGKVLSGQVVWTFNLSHHPDGMFLVQVTDFKSKMLSGDKILGYNTGVVANE